MGRQSHGWAPTVTGGGHQCVMSRATHSRRRKAAVARTPPARQPPPQTGGSEGLLPRQALGVLDSVFQFGVFQKLFLKSLMFALSKECVFM